MQGRIDQQILTGVGKLAMSGWLGQPAQRDMTDTVQPKRCSRVSDLWQARKNLIPLHGQVRLQTMVMA